MVCGEQPSKVVEREEGVGIVETVLILAIAAFYLAVVARGVGRIFSLYYTKVLIVI